MAFLSALDWPIRIALGVLVAASIGTGTFFLVRTSGSGSNQQAVALATSTPTVAATTTAPVATAVSNPAVTPAATLASPTATPDTRVAIRNLPTRDQVQQGPDGKYFIVDRGDGCRWSEHARDQTSLGELVVLTTDCPADFAFEFRVATGEVFLLVP